jgi:nitrate reductase gamma subunit
MREFYSYKASGLRYRSRVFEWQLFSSRIIFTTVILLVTSGIVFAAIQFRAGLKRPRAAASDVATEIDLSTSSVKVSSPVLGVIILVISLAFFYLYLVYVYPISEVV